MPKAKSKTKMLKWRIQLRGGPENNKILDYCAEALPDQLFVPAPPLDMSTTASDCAWKVAVYDRSDDPGEFDIQSYYDWADSVVS